MRLSCCSSSCPTIKCLAKARRHRFIFGHPSTTHFPPLFTPFAPFIMISTHCGSNGNLPLSNGRLCVVLEASISLFCCIHHRHRRLFGGTDVGHFAINWRQSQLHGFAFVPSAVCPVMFLFVLLFPPMCAIYANAR